MATITQSPPKPPGSGLFNSKRGRILRENLTAYLFLFPAGLLMFIFGIFPVAFAFFVSLHQWRRFPGEYRGLGNYERALGNLGYILFVWIAIGLIVYSFILLRRNWQHIRESGDAHGWSYLLPAIVNATSIIVVVVWFFRLLPIVMDIPRRVRGQVISLELFMSELRASFQDPSVASLGNIALVLLIMAPILSLVFLKYVKSKEGFQFINRWTMICIMIVSAFALTRLTLTEIQTAIETAREAGEELPIWSQTLIISLGFGLFYVAYKVWKRAVDAYEDRNFFLSGVAALLLAVGAYVLIAEFPRAVTEADDDFLQGFVITFLYALGTVPVQLAIGLGLAYLLFQKIRGQTFFRMIYFIPYITPFVATSIVFRIFFSPRETSIANQVLSAVGIPPQQWILEPTSIGNLMFNGALPDWLAGPSLALIVIMLFTTWTYVGYDAIIFLAGLGNIPPELYEAARIDGASGWRVFRHITFPLLSPTTFFLSLIAVIGTFKAFTQIWIMRTAQAGPTVDTASVFIFDELNTNSRYGYASAMAFVLFAVILMLTLFQNRILGRKVFYG